MKAAIYLRVSTAMQAESGLGLEVQEERGRALVASRGWEVAEVFREEGASARPGKRRPVFDQLVARANEFDVVVFHKLDRLGRSARELLQTFDDLESRGVVLVSVEGGVDTSTSAGRLIRTVLAAVAEFEGDLISERATAANTARVQRGQHHGHAPFGYTSIDGELLAVERDAAVVRRIFEAFAAGEPQVQIARALNADGIVTGRGRPWNQSTISRLLRNVTYLGRVTINGAEFAGRHDAIINPELWERAHAQLSGPRGRGNPAAGRPSSGRHLFTRGLLRCAHCGYGMAVRTDGRKGAESYHCLGHMTHGPAFCPMTAVPREAIDVAAFRYFQTVGLDVEQARVDLENQLGARVREARLLRDDQEAALLRLRETLHRWDDLLAAGELVPAEWRRLHSQTESEVEAADGRLGILNSRVAELEASDIPVEAREEVLRRLAELRAAVAGEIAGADALDQVRAQLRRLFDHFDVGRTDLEADPEMPPEMRAARAAELAEARTTPLASPEGTWLIIPWPRSETIAPLEFEWMLPFSGGADKYDGENPSGYLSTLPLPPFLGLAPEGWKPGRRG